MEQQSDHVGQSIEPTSPSTGRKAYAAPHLVEYGSAAKLTQGVVGSPRRKPGNAPAKMR